MIQSIIQAIISFFKFGTSVNDVVEKSLPDAELQKQKFELKKKTLSDKEIQKQVNARNKLIDEMFNDLKRHPEISISDKVNYEAAELSESEKELIIKILTERLTANKIYNKKKSDL